MGPLISGADLAHLAPAARQGICPLCGRGPWRALAKHTAKAHGIDARELKRRLGIPVSHGLNDPATTEAQRDAKRAAGAPPGLIEAGRSSARAAHIGPAGQAAKMAGLDQARQVSASRRRKIPIADLPRIRERIANGERLADVGRAYGASASVVCRALAAHPPREEEPAG